jgi:NSS family neurotransmitter:Na+ symporter
VGWKMSKADVRDEFTNGGTLKANCRIWNVFYFLVRYICPAGILIIFISGFFGS